MSISKIQSESMNLADTFAFTGSVSGAGKILSFGSYNSGYGSGARLSTTSTSWVNLEINGTNQAVFGQITKNSDDSLNYNKLSNSSHLIIGMNVPVYNNNGNNGHGFRLKFETTQDSGTYNVLDITNEGPAHGWGWHGYGGATSSMNNCIWNTYDNATYRSAIQGYTGNVRFFFEVRNWTSNDSIAYNDYNDSYPKYSTFTVFEVAV
tara:strand:+ start:23310 stop:23930 length:621 start_codon:yes stop_codon:yes gene_type:complete